MEPDELLERFRKLQVWSAHGQRAPHKPLLALWAIGRCLRGEERLASYLDADRALRKLLRAFGPHRRVIHTEQPFWRLRTDGVWEVQDAERVTLTTKGDAHRSSLLGNDIHAGFPESIQCALQADEALAERVAHALVKAHFPPTVHDEVLEAVGIEMDHEPGYEQSRQRKRNREFRERVLSAYGYACAVCGFAVCHEGEPLALEAAHIKWHQARGPDIVRNGLSLCALHHRLFDKGAFTVSPHRRIVIARNVSGSGFTETLGRFDAKALSPPVSADDVPDPRFSAWHAREVFGCPEHPRSGRQVTRVRT